MINFTSKVRHGEEVRYQKAEKLALAIFKADTDYSIRNILQKPELSGQMLAWSVEQSEFDTKFETRGPIKSQVLADFKAKLTPTLEKEVWILNVDGSSNSHASGARIILESSTGISIEQALGFSFKPSNH